MGEVITEDRQSRPLVDRRDHGPVFFAAPPPALPGFAAASSSAVITLITVVIFLASMGFMSLGFVLEFLSDLLNAVTHRKPYRIASITQHESAESPAISLPLIDHRAA